MIHLANPLPIAYVTTITVRVPKPKLPNPNSLPAGAPQYQLNKLLAVMNSAGQLICGLNKFDHISRVLCDRLHWLPV